MTAYDVAAWETFALGMLGAAAVLLGLIFVALSINLDALLRMPVLLRRAAAAIALLVAVLLATSFLLVPGQSAAVVGIELAATGLLGLVVVLLLLVRHRSSIDAAYRRRFDEAAVWGAGIQALFVVGGLSLMATVGGGLYWLVPAVMLGLVRAVTEAWVLLVEIKR